MSQSGLKTTVVLALSAVLCLPAMGLAAQKEPAQKRAVPLSAAELYEIYRDRTWVWNTGGGRFIGNGRQMVAWVDDGGRQSFAQGKWTIDDFGQLCMRATWTNAEGAARASTCFGHQKVGGTIYQRRQPDGQWYVFKHARPRAGDEFNKLVARDTISMKAQELKQTLTARN